MRSSTSRVRLLTEGDRAAVEALLRAQIDTSMFLLSNLRAAGFTDEGKRLQGTYVGSFDGGALTGVVCHAWNGMLLLQAPESAAELAREAVRLSGREVEGAAGPLEQVRALKLGEGLRPEGEVLMTLDTRELKAPLLARACRRPKPEELPLLAAWRYDYIVELELGLPGDETRREAEAEIARGDLFVLEVEGALVAMTGFNARLPECVQIGGVYTPPALRGRGYAKAVVAGSLLQAGAPRAVLFTGENSLAAQAAYRSLGFRVTGQFGLLLLG